MIDPMRSALPPADPAALAEVRALADGPLAGEAVPLLDWLYRLNEAWGGLHVAHLRALAGELGQPLPALQEAARHARLPLLADGEQPSGLTLHLCDGPACALAGSAGLQAQARAMLDGAVRILSATCLGRCDQAPAALVGQVPVAPATAASLLNTLRREAACAPGRMGSARGAPDAVGDLAYRAAGGYALAAALANEPAAAERVLDVVAEAGVHGAQGPLAGQWRALRAQAAPRVLTVAIGGTAGAFADRQHIERDPHRFLEGLLIAAQVVGAESAVIVLADDHHDARVLLAAELQRLRAHPPFPLPKVVLRRGAGVTLCGQSAEWSGEPAGNQDFEVLFGLRELLEKGAAWSNGHGRRGARGLRHFSVSGRVQSPGVKRAPAGISLRELVDEYCDGMADGAVLQAYLPGGLAGGILPAHLADLPLDDAALQPYGGALGPAAIVVLGRQDGARA
ncbi:MAG: NADH:ubiquinone oxidoreductase subunit 2 or 24 kDa subunit and subunit 1 or 51 kDa subunit fusion, partial [Ramlibacter sp.]|nr:NADH:ubiquinone oxidoreductase subunit 2 or 24 kDa subunit and subunit 1 or 51 kDa subunit fusion [Ramlibacter sp.]